MERYNIQHFTDVGIRWLETHGPSVLIAIVIFLLANGLSEYLKSGCIKPWTGATWLTQ
jgi:hypothetical protein